MRYYQVTFHIEPDTQDARDILSALSADAGFESFTEQDDKLCGFVNVESFDKDALNKAIEDFPIPGVKVEYELKECEDKDWNEEWERSGFEPIVIGGRCIVYDVNNGLDENLAQHADLKIGIDAHQAFGTGTHETTQMIVETLLDNNLEGKRVLDCGCGTGILGIVAAKLGAKEVVGYDIDDWSVRNTEHNAELNGVSIDVLEGDKRVLSHVSGMFDVVLANINRNILLADMDAYVDVMNGDGTLILSGFYESDVEMLLQKATELGLSEVGRKSLNNWCCLVLKK